MAKAYNTSANVVKGIGYNCTMHRAVILLMLSIMGCSFLEPTPDPNLLIQQAVAGTMAAQPPTSTPPLLPTPYPSPTPMTLAGLFCEYQFCIGHPTSMAFYDHLASLNPLTPSTYANGFMAAYQLPTMLINLIWLQAPGTADPQFLLDTLLDDQADTRTGNLDVKLVRGMNVMYTPISTTISPDVPFGGAAAWTCGDRVFAWKVYAPNAESPGPLFEEALARFSCNQ
jgi:hypothetical protein